MMCGYQMVEEYVESDATQGPAMKRMQAKGAILHTWNQETLDKFEAAWKDVAAEESGKNPVFKKVFDSYQAFRAEYAIWKDRGYLK